MTEAQQFAFASLTRGDLFPWATIRDAARVKFGFHTLGGRYLERRFRGRRGQLPGIQRTWHPGAAGLGCRSSRPPFCTRFQKSPMGGDTPFCLSSTTMRARTSEIQSLAHYHAERAGEAQMA